MSDLERANKILGDEISMKLRLAPVERTVVLNAMLKFHEEETKLKPKDEDNRNTSMEVK
jgi:hypothetical protein